MFKQKTLRNMIESAVRLYLETHGPIETEEDISYVCSFISEYLSNQITEAKSEEKLRLIKEEITLKYGNASRAECRKLNVF